MVFQNETLISWVCVGSSFELAQMLVSESGMCRQIRGEIGRHITYIATVENKFISFLQKKISSNINGISKCDLDKTWVCV